MTSATGRVARHPLHPLPPAEYDAQLAAIMRATGVDRPRAIVVARANGIVPAERSPAELAQQLAQQQRDARVREKAEQAAVIKILREYGFTVRATSQARASRVAIGLPDLWCTHRTAPLACWFEVKRQVGGIVSEAQQQFAYDCSRCGVRWYSGDRYDAERVCVEAGLRKPE